MGSSEERRLHEGLTATPLDRSHGLLAYLLTEEVRAGTRIMDTFVDIPDGSRPFEATCEVVSALCSGLDGSAVEIALLLRREGFTGTVENLLATASSLAR
jgi:hypothetical protein